RTESHHHLARAARGPRGDAVSGQHGFGAGEAIHRGGGGTRRHHGYGRHRTAGDRHVEHDAETENAARGAAVHGKPRVAGKNGGGDQRGDGNFPSIGAAQRVRGAGNEGGLRDRLLWENHLRGASAGGGNHPAHLRGAVHEKGRQHRRHRGGGREGTVEKSGERRVRRKERESSPQNYRGHGEARSGATRIGARLYSFPLPLPLPDLAQSCSRDSRVKRESLSPVLYFTS